MSANHAIQRLGWFARRVGLRPAPLRRRVDRWENVARAVTVAVALAALPIGVPIGHSVFQNALAESAIQTAQRHQVTATLLANAPNYGGDLGMSTQVPAQARWTGQNGAVHTGQIAVDPGQRAGSHVPVWVDSSGRPVDSPLTPDQAYFRGLLAGLAACAASTTLVMIAFGLLRRRFNRIRASAWCDEWERVEPRWTRHRQ